MASGEIASAACSASVYRTEVVHHLSTHIQLLDEFLLVCPLNCGKLGLPGFHRLKFRCGLFEVLFLQLP